MNNQWEQLADAFAADANQGNTEDYAIDNVLIAWPALFRGIAQSFDTTAQLKVLDFGCGGGLLGNQLAAKGYEVTGYDASSAMTAAARQNARAGVTIVDNRSAALRPTTYDVVLSCMVLPFIEDLSAIAAEFAASLKPGGLILYATFNPAFILENRQHAFFPPSSATEPRQLELKPGVRIPFYDRGAADYQRVFAALGYQEVYQEQPAFTPEFLARYPMPFSTQAPEYLIQGFCAREF